MSNRAAFIYNVESQLTEQDGWALGGEGHDETTFEYNLDGTLKEEDVDNGKADGGTTSTTYTYDLRGRQIEEYTPANIAEGTNAVTINSAYDIAGNRVLEGSAYFLVDDNNPTGYSQVLEERDGSATAALARSYVIGLDVLGQTIGNPSTSEAIGYLIYDGGGSIRQTVDSSQMVQSTWSYDAFGNITGGYNQSLYTGSGRGRTYLGPASDLTFQGGYANPDGTINFRARNYNPVTGGFTTQDSLSFAPGDIANSNLYLFVNGDPINFNDPTGHFTTQQGNIIHAAIEGMYQAEHIGHSLLRFGTAIPNSMGLLYPDIMDYTLGEVGEIKPLTPYGLSTGLPQLRNYLNGLNSNGAVSRGGAILPLPATANDAGKPWTPSTWQVGVQPVPVFLPGQLVFTVGNAGGVIYYTSYPEPEYSLQTATNAAKDLAQQIQSYSSILANPNDPAYGAVIQQISLSISLGNAQQNVSHLAADTASFLINGLFATLGLSLMLDTLGGVALA